MTGHDRLRRTTLRTLGRLSIIWLACCVVPARAAEPTCRSLATASALGSEAPEVAWASPIAAAVVGAERRLMPGPEPRVAFVHSDVPGAWYCRGADTVYVSRALARYAHLGRASDGADLLAFAVAHELAHRRFDADTGTRDRSAAIAGAREPEREAAADERAAFLIALARAPGSSRGFSPWNLARRETLARLMHDEYDLDSDSPEAQRRLRARSAALDRMDELAQVYEVALALAFAPLAVETQAGEVHELADALLARLDATLNRPDSWARAPELSLVRAILNVSRAARARGVSCRVSYARHAMLSPFDALGARGARGVEVDALLAVTRAALADARTRGLPAVLIASVRSCAARVERARHKPSPRDGHTPPQHAPIPGEGAHELADGVALERMALAADRACADADAPPRVLEAARVVTITLRTSGHGRCFEVRGAEGVRVAMLTPRPGAEADLAAWAAACELWGDGVGDDGSEAVGAYCPGVDAGCLQAWTLFGRDGRVERAVRVTFRRD